MVYRWHYKTPEVFDDILLQSDGTYLTGLWFLHSKDEKKQAAAWGERMLPVFEETIKWLDLYFAGETPDFTPKYKIEDMTTFREEVFSIMKDIPYGKTATYGEIGQRIAISRGVSRMSAQAVGGAVGWNPICIIVPCHRVVGAGGKLTGYGGGIKNKLELLKLEGVL